MNVPHFIQTDADKSAWPGWSDEYRAIVTGRYGLEREALENRIREDSKSKGETAEQLAGRLAKVAAAGRQVVTYQLRLFWTGKR